MTAGPCPVCMWVGEHAPECEGSPRQTLAEVLARAQSAQVDQLRERARRFLAMPGLRQRRTLLAKKGEACARCADSPRYPDHRCATHSGYLPEAPIEARQLDNDDASWLGIWRDFFARVDQILKS